MNGTGFIYDPMIGPISTLTGKPQPTFDEKIAFANAVAQHFKTTLFGQPYMNPYSHNMGEAAKQMQAMEGSVMNQGLPWMMGEVQDVFHGSPFKFSKFSTSKIGTGEGAQAFGWGLYFSDEKSIAKHYQKAQYGAGFKIKGKNVSEFETPAASSVEIASKTGKDIEEASILFNSNEEKIRRIASYMKSYGDNYIDFLPKELIELNNKLLKSGDITQETGALYKATLHKGKDPSEYTWLDWDKPIDQSTHKNIIDRVYNEFGGDSRVFEKLATLNPAVRDITGEQYYRALSSGFNSQKEASLFLNRAGITGIRYPAGSLSGISYKVKDPAHLAAAKNFEESGYSLEDALVGMKKAYKNAEENQLKLALGVAYKKPDYGIPKNYVVFDENAITIEETLGF